MMQTVTREQALAGTLALVNPAHPLQARPRPKRWSPPCRTRPACCWRGRRRVMLGSAAGRHPRGGAHRAVSGWRSHAEQQALYADSVRDNGLEFTQKYVALPAAASMKQALPLMWARRGR